MSEFVIEDGTLVTYWGKTADIVIPEGVHRIGDNAFVACKLTSIVLPASVAELGNGAFSSCTELRRSELT